jgi:GNAT superfamily N-acetyltransferase
VRHEPPEAPQLLPGVEVRRVENVQCFQDFREIAAQGFRDEAPGCYDLVLSIFPDPATVLAPDTSAFVVYVDGLPVSTGLTMLKNGIAWIGWVATRQEARGHGYGRLATIAAVRAGFTLGATLASLEATRIGVPVYLRLGFR